MGASGGTRRRAGSRAWQLTRYDCHGVGQPDTDIPAALSRAELRLARPRRLGRATWPVHARGTWLGSARHAGYALDRACLILRGLSWQHDRDVAGLARAVPHHRARTGVYFGPSTARRGVAFPRRTGAS